EVGVRSSDHAAEWVRSARISAYRSDVDNLISFKYVGQLYLVPRFQYANIAHARIEGIEATAQLRHERWELGLSGTLPRGTALSSGKKLDDIGSANATLELIAPVSKWLPNGTFSVRVRWNDALTGVTEALRQPAFSTTSLQADAIMGGVRWVLAVN